MSKKVKAVGSKAEVWHGNAKHTSGGLTKADLMKNSKGRIVSKKKHAQGKKNIKFLFDAGYKPKKGEFVAFKKKRGPAKKKRRKKAKCVKKTSKQCGKACIAKKRGGKRLKCHKK